MIDAIPKLRGAPGKRLALATALFALPGVAMAAQFPAGRWYTEGDKAVIQIGPCGGALCGRIEHVLKADPGASRTDVHNPDPALRGRPIEGLSVLTGLRADGDRWLGEVYDPQTGKRYKAIVAPGPADTLKLTGCLWVLCQTHAWRRAQ